MEAPLNVYEVLGAGPLRTKLQVAARRGLTRFVGRQSELEPLDKAVEQGAYTTHHETRTKLAEAHQMLSEVYNWFTEGFDTKDLQEAKELLEELDGKSTS